MRELPDMLVFRWTFLASAHRRSTSQIFSYARKIGSHETRDKTIIVKMLYCCIENFQKKYIYKFNLERIFVAKILSCLDFVNNIYLIIFI